MACWARSPYPPICVAAALFLAIRPGSTIGNADETQLWMTAENYRSLRLVTANYHMPRSLLLFHKAMPDIVIIPHPVTPDSVKLYEWWQHPGTIDLLATEYSKYLFVQFRLRLEAAPTATVVSE